ncbi:uncharacterized protein ARMOST_20393 [Armillaria ostoyae]|uniref:Uncharacterized protein n=1 Tax=Armillaria ostoyae TaxID=47428 RepID=A0A284S788_ARMOS|nr:uncharacterized protein ARMOST_20393 [Armillaria ostoyae]
MIDGEPLNGVPFLLFLFIVRFLYLAHGGINPWSDKEKVVYEDRVLASVSRSVPGKTVQHGEELHRSLTHPLTVLPDSVS